MCLTKQSEGECTSPDPAIKFQEKPFAYLLVSGRLFLFSLRHLMMSNTSLATVRITISTS